MSQTAAIANKGMPSNAELIAFKKISRRATVEKIFDCSNYNESVHL